MYDEVQSLIRRNTCDTVPRKYVTGHQLIKVTCSFKCKTKPDGNISKFNAKYYVGGYVEKILYPEPLETYYLVLQWNTVILMLIMMCVSNS